MENLAEFLHASIRLTTPLLLAALGGAFMQVAAVPNIGMEGMMLIAALVGYIVSFTTGSWVLGLIAGVLSAVLVGLIYSFFVLRLKADIFAIGITLNILMAGVAAYIIRQYYDQISMLLSPNAKLLPTISIPALATNKVINSLFNNYSILIPISFLLVLVTYFIFYKTPFGFWLRAAGSNPLAVSASGKNITGIRFAAFIISAAFCGLAGAHLSLGYLGMFALSLVAGRGFVALAIVLFGNGNPITLLIASLIFGMADAASLRIPIEVMPPQFPLMLPYIVTILAITLMSRFSRSFTGTEQQ
ncbi:MAG: ABC transporter permease [Leptolinea sp.]|jgi:simple sugar transport system permease protein|nr:ABC transporter permease [Leptolinea sp.]